MNILVSGAAGFIGSHLCEKLLDKGNRVTGIDNFDNLYSRDIKEENLQNLLLHPNFIFNEINLENFNDLITLESSFDCVLHLAAKAGVLPSIKDPSGYLTTNVMGTQNLLDFMKMRGISKLVFASSSSVYGNNKTIPFKESDPVDQPISPYAFSKKSCELLNHTYHHLFNIDVINLRFFTVYGPRQRPDLAIHKFFKLIYSGQAITIYGDGSTARDYTYVSDTVQGIVNAVDYITNSTNVFEVINLGNHSPVKLTDLVSSIYSVTERQPNLIYIPMQPGDVDYTYADITKAENLLNYFPKTSLRQGLQKFDDWFKQKIHNNTITIK